MSVFGVKEYWRAKVGAEEEFDVRSLCFYNQTSIVIGSLQGVLRIINPQQGDFRIEQMQLEQKMNSILQVSSGKFTQQSDETLAILHPRSLGVYLVQDSSLRLCFEHRLQRNAFNFTYGSFGQYSNYGHDFICIQSSDGALGFYEYQNYVFAVQLPSFLAPNSIFYSKQFDSFILANSSMEIETYRYSKLRDAYQRYQQGQDANFDPDVRINLGEYVQDIQQAFQGSFVDYYVLGEHSLFGVKETGGLKLSKKLDYVPSCMAVYREDGVIVGSFTGHMMIYNRNYLIWSCKLNTPAIWIGLISLDVQSLLISCGEYGEIEIDYLGTAPLPYNLVYKAKQLDYGAIDAELRQINSQLRDPSAIQEPVNQIQVTIENNDQIIKQPHLAEGFYQDSQGVVATRATFTFAYPGTISNVNIDFQCPLNISCLEAPYQIESINGNHRQIFHFVTNPDISPSLLQIKLVLTYYDKEGPRVQTQFFQITPLQVGQVVNPIKEADCRITLVMMQPIPGLSNLFPEFVLQSPNAMSIRFFNKSHGTLIIGKSGDRIRIQASSFDALWMMSDLLIQKVGADLIRFEEPLPLLDVYKIIEDHFQCRKDIKDKEEKLGQLCEQYTAIQKRILVRFKDRNPAQLNNLDYLLQSTHMQLSRLADDIEQQQSRLLDVSGKLSAAVNLLNFLIKARFGLSQENYRVLQQILSNNVTQGEQGWEEMTDAAVAQALKTSLAKSDKERQIKIPQFTFPQSIDKLRKHIEILCDRLSKGGRLIQ